MYNPTTIKVLVKQVLETGHIFLESSSVDTVAGRYDLFKSNIEELRLHQKNERYISDIQTAIDNYKQTYYDRIISETQMLSIVNPIKFPYNGFYSCGIIWSLQKFTDALLSDIDSLKLIDAKRKRVDKVLAAIDFAYMELKKINTTDETFNKNLLAIQKLRINYKNVIVE